MTDRNEPLELIAKLREGVVEHRKRWSGDTHSDIGGSVDYDATEHLMRQAATALEAQRDEMAHKDARIKGLEERLNG